MAFLLVLLATGLATLLTAALDLFSTQSGWIVRGTVLAGFLGALALSLGLTFFAGQTLVLLALDLLVTAFLCLFRSRANLRRLCILLLRLQTSSGRVVHSWLTKLRKIEIFSPGVMDSGKSVATFNFFA